MSKVPKMFEPLKFDCVSFSILEPNLIVLKIGYRWSRCKGFRKLQSNLKNSNTDRSFTMANSNSFLIRYGILPITQENKYLGKFSFLSWNCTLYVVCTHWKRLIEAFLMSTTICNYYVENVKDFPRLSLFASWPCAVVKRLYIPQK